MAKKPSRQNKKIATENRAATDEAFCKTGNGGETHQRVTQSAAHGGVSHLTTSQESAFDNQNSLKRRAGQRYLEFRAARKIFHFDHERTGTYRPCPRFGCAWILDAHDRSGAHQGGPVPAQGNAPQLHALLAVGAQARRHAARRAASRSSSIRSKATGTWLGNNIPVFFIQDDQVSRPGSFREDGSGPGYRRRPRRTTPSGTASV
jgi:hypothetical protein